MGEVSLNLGNAFSSSLCLTNVGTRVPALGVAEPNRRIRKKGEHCLSVASCAAPEFCGSAQGTRRARHGRKWFWVLLPKQKDLVGGGETLQRE